MSSKLKFLRQAQEQRESFSRNPVLKEVITESPISQNTKSGGINNLIYLILGVLFLLNIAFSITILVRIKAYSSEKTNAITKLTKMEQLINMVNSDFKRVRSDISKVQKDIDTQASNIQSLTKAKNILYNKVGELEEQLQAKGSAK